MSLDVLYKAMRAEILSHDSLLHWISLVVLLVLLAGATLVEQRQTILSVFLPLLSLAWSSTMLRLDFFIHRQGAYLRHIESQTLGLAGLPTWEVWKDSLPATKLLVPIADGIGCLAILVPTVYLLFGPSQAYFAHRRWRGAKIYSWGILALIAGQLLCLAVFPLLHLW